MSSRPITGIQTPTSCQPGHSGSFFSLPPEIRNIIYHYLAPKSSDPLFPSISQREHAIDRPRSFGKLQPPKATPSSKNLKPTCLALAHTCRQAYLESSTRHYANKTFLIYSGHNLRDFLSDVSPAHICSVEGLRITRPTLMIPLKPPTAGPTSAPKSAQELLDIATAQRDGPITSHHVALLRNFKGLRTLSLNDTYQAWNPILGGETMRMLAVGLGRSLPKLEKIVLKMEVPMRPRSGYITRCTDEGVQKWLPGWTSYHVHRSLGDIENGMEIITETLVREVPV